MVCHHLARHTTLEANVGAPLWPDTADEILDGDQVLALAYVTPASGVVVTPVTNLALRDREAGSVMAVNTSVGVWKKLDRIRSNPQVALVYHTRTHGFSDRPEYVLVQGRASLSAPVPDYPKTIRENWERFGGPADFGPLWRAWLRAWLLRVELEVAVERVLVWPDLACGGAPEVHGAALPTTPPDPQRPPANGTGPRIDHLRAAKRAGRLPNVLLGWVGSDGFPLVAPVEVAGPDERGIRLDVPEGLVPPGGRRAGLTGHWFARYTFGQILRKHTGWLEADAGARRVVYAPHTEKGYRLPESPFLFKLVAGGATWWGLRGARRAGILAA
jgi:hypothetical protein